MSHKCSFNKSCNRRIMGRIDRPYDSWYFLLVVCSNNAQPNHTLTSLTLLALTTTCHWRCSKDQFCGEVHGRLDYVYETDWSNSVKRPQSNVRIGTFLFAVNDTEIATLLNDHFKSPHRRIVNDVKADFTGHIHMLMFTRRQAAVTVCTYNAILTPRCARLEQNIALSSLCC